MELSGIPAAKYKLDNVICYQYVVADFKSI